MEERDFLMDQLYMIQSMRCLFDEALQMFRPTPMTPEHVRRVVRLADMYEVSFDVPECRVVILRAPIYSRTDPWRAALVNLHFSPPVFGPPALYVPPVITSDDESIAHDMLARMEAMRYYQTLQSQMAYRRHESIESTLSGI